MKITEQSERLMAAVSFLSAWDMSRACNPTWVSPMSPSISAFGTRAATLSMTTRSTALLRTRYSHISSACSALSGWDSRRSSKLTPQRAE